MKLESILKPVKKTLVALGLVSLLGATAFTVNYFATHKDKVQVEETSNGIEYSHPDKQTTHILNYIVGKEAITEEERADIFRDVIDYWCHLNDKVVPDLDDKSEREVMIWMMDNMDSSEKKDSVNKIMEDVEQIIPLKREWDPSLYESVWKLEMETGSPYLEWTIMRDDEKRTFLGYKSALYAPLTNTAKILPYDPIETLLAELSHAKQFSNNPFGYYKRTIKEQLRIRRKINSGQSFHIAQLEEYNLQGSLEHEAHQIIEPQLRQRIKRLK